MIQKKSGLFEATAWYGLGNVIVRSVGFLLLPLYSNLIPVEQFGIYSLMMSTYVIVGVFYQFGMNASLTNFYLKETDELRRKKVFSTIINSVIIISVSLTFLMILLSDYLSQKIIGTSNYRNLFSLLFITLFAETITTFILQLYKSLEQSKRVVLFLIIGAALNILLNVWFVYFQRLGIEGIILAQFISSVLVFLLLLPGIKNHYSFGIDGVLLKTVLLFSLPLFLSGVFASGIDVGDRFILDSFLGKKQVGEYSFAYRIAMITNVFVISFRTAWMPYALNRYHENNYRDHFGKTLLKLLSAGIFILLIVSFFAEDLFLIQFNGKHLFNPEYKGGLIILPFVIIGYIFSSLASYYSIYPFVSNKSYHFLISDGIGLIINLVINFLLIPIYGLIGAGIATCLSFGFTASYLFFISRNRIQINFQTKQILIIILAGLLLLIIGISFRNIFLQILLVIIYLLMVEFAVKIKISKLFRFQQ